MRKTKLIILPTKCLNRMGFLLLFLSCPVIGDWGRIRPDTEMSQWSILLDKEGSCGLIRNSRQSEMVSDGRMEYHEVSGSIPQSDTPMMTGHIITTERSKPDLDYKIQRRSDRRIARRDVRERRTISTERKNTFRRIENSKRNYRTGQEYRNDARRIPVDRRVRQNNEVIWNNSRRRHERDSDMRRIEKRVDSRRMEERRLSRRIQNDDATTRRDSSEMRLSRVGVGNLENRNVVERQEQRQTRRTGNLDRRTSEREVFQARRKDNTEERNLSARRVETRRDTSRQRVLDERRTMQRSTARRERSELAMRRNAVTLDARRNERSLERRETLEKRGDRRFVVDVSRKDDIRADKYRKPECNSAKKTARIDRYMGLDSRLRKQKEAEDAGKFKWELLGGMKNWFQKVTHRDTWVVNNDFATTCLVGATVYLLTMGQMKAA